ncbi:MAG: ATP-binding protein [Intestinibaculum porci]|uniref:ATP-binding protein n=1 Tax=Intestinibaculum porci TaxID=2487118 RepID=UPI0024093EC7|nr:ATP-binding protein [Intestinibaculum porci]MDD6421720.1 ATP-binding protein [Intestinibaculum porci]
MKRETKNFEMKEKMTKSFLKTVSAYANYNNGQIIFGIDDEGHTIGIDDPEQFCLNIENSINDNIKPIPDYDLQVTPQNTIILDVYKGDEPPYFYNGKAYKRHDSSSIPVSSLELRRLSLEGMHKDFEDLPARSQDLTFHFLETQLCRHINIEHLSEDVLKTLGLYDGTTYNIAAELLSDQNSFPGVDLIRFGDSIDQILFRKTFSHTSILKILEDTIEVFKEYYTYDIISGMTRNHIEQIPEKAFREALANAIVHREWDLPSSVQIAMYKDRIEITSPGGLPAGLSQYEYLNTMISNLRNPKIAEVFLKIDLIEKLDTGVTRIKEAYKHFQRKPLFQVNENSITVTLPLITQASHQREYLVMKELENKGLCSRKELEQVTGMKTDRLIRLLNKMIADHIVEKVGKGRATKYKLND